MKKVLLALLLVASASFAADSVADHEAKMQQMQERTQTRVKDGSGQQIRNQNQYQNRSGEVGNSDSGSKKMYKGSKGQGGGGNTGGGRGGKGR